MAAARARAGQARAPALVGADARRTGRQPVGVAGDRVVHAQRDVAVRVGGRLVVETGEGEHLGQRPARVAAQVLVADPQVAVGRGAAGRALEARLKPVQEAAAARRGPIGSM